MRFNILLLFALVAMSNSTYSQSTLSGRVTDTKNQPLDGAHIHIGERHSLSNPAGFYELHNIPNGQQRVVISYIGYSALDTILDIREDMVLNAVLKPQSTQLEEVVLSESARVSKSAVVKQDVKLITLEKYSSATLGDALKEIPGVYSLKTGNSIVKPVINGLHSSRVPVLVNNVRLEDQQWGTEHAPNLDINSAGKVSVIKGASALQYGGDAIGGLVLVEPVSVLKDTLYGRSIVSLNSNGRGGSITSSLHKGAEKGWAWNAGGTFKYFGDREAPDYVLSNTGNREGNFFGDVKYIADTYDISASYSFYNATIGIASATHIGSTADLANAINSGIPAVVNPFTYTIKAPKQEIQHHLAKLNFNTDLSPFSKLALQYAFQLNHRKEFDIRRGDDRNKAALDLTLITHSLQADWKYEKDDNTLKGGVSFAMQNNEASPDTGIRPLIPNYNRTDAGAYAIAAHRFTNSFSAEAGLRYDFSHVDADKFYQKSRWTSLGYEGEFDNFIVADYGTQWLTNPTFTYNNISASLGINKQFNSNWELFANAGLTMRNPNPSELFSDGLHHSNGTIELGDLRTQKEESYKLSTTLKKQGSIFSFEVTPYANFISNFIFLKPTGAEYTIRGSFPVYQYTQNDALLTGVDFHSDVYLGKHLKYSLNMAYVHGTNRDTDEPLIDMPPFIIGNSLLYTFNDRHNFYLELNSQAVFKQNRYPNYNFYADVPQDGELVPVLVDVSTPPPGYHLLNFSSGMDFTLGKTLTSVSFTVNNIFNTSYRDYLNRQRLYTDDIGRNFILQLKFNY